MALDAEVKAQLLQYLALIESDIVFQASLGTDKNSKKVRDLIDEIILVSDKIGFEEKKPSRTPAFRVVKKGQESGVEFAGLPLGHELTSSILALLQVSGQPPKVDEEVINRIKAIDTPLHFEAYVSLSCHNCPGVVQAFNIMAVTSPNISHTTIEGGMFQDEVKAKGIMSVPTVFHNDEILTSGRISIEQLLDLIVGPVSETTFADKGIFDVLVIGGGPAGNSTAIYTARKGIKTGLLAEAFGGQVVETVGVENMIGTPYIEGPALMSQAEKHTKSYDVDIMEAQKAIAIHKKGVTEATLASGAILKSKTAILSLGTRWHDINVPGEVEFRNKRVTYCPHCDEPLFTNKKVAVIGGGNSGPEAAIDLAGLTSHVYILEFLPGLRAGRVLQDRVEAHDNITILENVATKKIPGDEQVTGLIYTDRETDVDETPDLEEVFVQIGPVPSTDWLKDSGIDLNNRGGIIMDNQRSMTVAGIFAAGDRMSQAYKQIIISMRNGATAALDAFNYLIRISD